jgi:hypothetical protein
LKSYQGHRQEDLLAEGGLALQQGQPGRAADIFGRALLLDPQDPRAREGAAAARAGLEEAHRLRDARLAEAESALGRGAVADARRILEALGAGGADDERWQALRDRLDGPRPGRVTSVDQGTPPPWPVEAPAIAPRRNTWSRLVVTAGWAAGFGLLATGVASSWDNLLGQLQRTPMPHTGAGAPATVMPRATRGERLLVDARKLLDAGDVKAALATLDQVVPEEPAYPLARKLRDEAELMQRAGGRRP